MSSVLDRSELEQSPLADLHLLANELGVDGFRRLRREELIDAIVARQSGSAEAEAEGEGEGEPDGDGDDAVAVETDEDSDERRPRRGRRGGRGRGRARLAEEGATDEDAGDDDRPARGRSDEDRPARGRGDDEPERNVEGVVELLANGSGFIRLSPPEPTDDDVYISAAQVKRCELVSGDRIGGPLRPPRRSERFPSLVRVDTINGRPADEVAEGTRFEDLPAAFPAERFELGSDDPTVKAIEWLTPFGKGSRVVFAGPARAGKSEALRRLHEALGALEGLEVTLVLAGVRPEELGDTGGVTFAASSDAQAQSVEQAIEQGRRVAARGGDAVVLVDTLEYLPPQAARRALAAARNIAGGGSLTVIATAPAPLGGETTVVTFDATLTALGRFPAIDLATSGVVHPELLVGDAGAEAIAKARTEALPG
jgi:transcription termination factor Rho